MGPLDSIGAAGVIFKAKYVKRTGTSGNYKYWYRNPKTGKLQAGKQPAKKPSGKQTPAKKEITLTHRQEDEALIGKIPSKELNRIRDEREKHLIRIRKKFESERYSKILHPREKLDREENALIKQTRKEEDNAWKEYSDEHAKLAQKYKPKYEIE